MKSLKVIQITSYFSPNNKIEKVSSDISDVLSKEHNVINLSLNYSNIYIEEIYGDSFFIRCNTIFQFYRKFKRLVNGFSPDVIHFHFPNPKLVNILLKILNNNSKIKLITHYHYDLENNHFYKWIIDYQTEVLLKRSIKVITTSTSYIEDSKLLSRIKDKVKIIPNPFSIKLLSLNDNIIKLSRLLIDKYKNNYLVLYIGDFVKENDLDYLLKSTKFLNYMYKVVIIGDGDIKDNMFKNPIVEYIGNVDDDIKYAYMLACKCYLHPAISKNNSYEYLLEAMVLKKPSVTFRVFGSSINYICPNNICCLEARLYDCRGYANNIVKICEDEGLYETLSINSYNRAIRLFSSENFNEVLLRLYKDEIG